MIINSYEYLFYKLYQWSIKVNGDSFYYHKAHACIMISVAFGLNIITILGAIYTFTGIIVVPSNTPKLFGAPVAIGVFIINYAYFSFGGHYSAIIDRYKNETMTNAKRGNIIVVIYVIGSFVLMGVSGFLGVYINQLRQGM